MMEADSCLVVEKGTRVGTQNPHITPKPSPIDERVRAGLSHQDKRKDARVLADLTELYCRANHKDRTKAPLESIGTREEVYARTYAFCDECAEFVRFSEKRTGLCRQDPKPFCAFCDIKCYSPAMKEYSRQVMHFAGPRSIFTCHAPAAVSHIVKGLVWKIKHRQKSV